jgi:hypothetical protein
MHRACQNYFQRLRFFPGRLKIALTKTTELADLDIQFP